jgi:hypothetical protein
MGMHFLFVAREAEHMNSLTLTCTDMSSKTVIIGVFRKGRIAYKVLVGIFIVKWPVGMPG